METSKKLSNGQLQKKIKNALVFVPKDKDYKTVFFDDKMLRLECTEDFCVISTGYHRHVFDAMNFNQGGYSRPYLYTKRIIEITLENLKDDGVVTYEHLLDVLSVKEEKTDYNIATYYQWWLFNIFQPLYQIGESTVETFLVYEQYLHNIAKSSLILGEKTEDLTNIGFVNKVTELERNFVDGIEETVVFPKMTDEEMMEKEFDAVQEQAIKRNIENASTDKEIK